MYDERINQIKNQIRDLISRITSMGEEPPQEIRDLLSQFIQRSQAQIDQIRAEEAAAQQQQPQQEPNAPPTQPSPIPPGPLGGAPSYDARFLWILAGRQEQAFISYLRTFPTPATRSLLTNPQALNSTIVHLQRSMPEGEHEPIVENGIPHAPLQSSNVWGANYDQQSGKMKVRFQGGSEYEYDGVPPAIFNAFIHGNANARTKGENQYGRWWENKNPSLGAALNQYIKEGGFSYRRTR